MGESSASTVLVSIAGGAYARTDYPSFAAHLANIITTQLGFHPSQQPQFDGALCKAYPNHAPLIDPNHASYGALAPLRTNLVVLRNFLLQTYGDAAALAPVAHTIGDMLKQGESLFKNPFALSITLNDANQWGVGAATLYGLLLKKYPQLPPLAQTPFARLDPNDIPTDTNEDDDFRARTTEEAVAAAAALNDHGADMRELSDEELDAVLEEELDHDTTNDLAAISDKILKIQQRHNVQRSVEELDDKTKSRAIELGREILRKLRFHFSDVPIDQLMTANPDAIRSVMNDVRKVTDIFSKYLEDAAQRMPEMLEDTHVMAAMNAAGKLAAQAKLYAIKEAREAGDITQMNALIREHAALPEQWRNPPEKRLGELLDQLDKGLKLLQAKLLDATSNLPDNDQLKDMQSQDGGMMPVGGLSSAQQAHEQAQRQRLQLEMIQQDEYARMMAQRRQANQTRQGGTVTAQRTNAPASNTSGQTISAAALETPRGGNAQSTAPLQQNTANNPARANRPANPQGNNPNRNPANNPMMNTAMVAPPRQQRNNQNIMNATPSGQSANPNRNRNNQFDNLLGGMNVQQMRGAINTPTSGTMVEPNSAKKVVQDRLREGTERRNAPAATTTAPATQRRSDTTTPPTTQNPATQPTTEPPRDPNAPKKSGPSRG